MIIDSGTKFQLLLHISLNDFFCVGTRSREKETRGGRIEIGCDRT